MKFEYDKKPSDSDCVAFISDNGNLLIKNTDTGDFTIALCVAGAAHNKAVSDGVKHAHHRFYPGDKITITF